MEVFNATEIQVPTTVTITDMKAARMIVVRSFHKNTYAEEENTCGISW